MLYTVSAVQILAMLGAFEELEQLHHGAIHKIGHCEISRPITPHIEKQDHADTLYPPKVIASLQDEKSGSFAGDEWGEVDTRFLYGAFNALSLLGLLDLVDVEKAVRHIHSCANFDGGFGTSPEAESHAGQIFVCVAALTIAGRSDILDRDKLGAWLSERQLPSGGLNGRPEKLEDVCYSWWVVSSLAMIGRRQWIDHQQLTAFILNCQDTEQGGISDRPGDMVDVFHTVFGLAGLSLVGYGGLEEVDPVYCMPKRTIENLGLARE